MKRYLAGVVVGVTILCTGGVAHAQYGGGDVPSPDDVLGEELVRTPPGSTQNPGADAGGTQSSPAAGGNVASAVAQRPSEVLGVSVSRGSLARTGQDALPVVAASAALMGVGAALVAGSRRRSAALPA